MKFDFSLEAYICKLSYYLIKINLKKMELLTQTTSQTEDVVIKNDFNRKYEKELTICADVLLIFNNLLKRNNSK